MDTIPPPSPELPPDCCALVAKHQSYRGLKVEQPLLGSFAMYIVELDQLGLFISDSRPEAFHMAFEALRHPATPT